MSSSKKRRFSHLESLPSEDMHKFWTLTHKEKFLTFMNCSLIPGWVINLSLIKDSHCKIGHFFKALGLLMMFLLCGLEVFKDLIHMFFANLRLSPDNEELETLVLGAHIILNDFYLRKYLTPNFWVLFLSWMEPCRRILKSFLTMQRRPSQILSHRITLLVICPSVSAMGF